MPPFSQGCWHTSAVSCNRLSAPPGPPSSCQPQAGAPSSPVHVVRARVGQAVGMASAPPDSTRGQRTALGKKTSPLPCQGILPRLAWAHRGHQDLTGARRKFQWALLWDKVPRDTGNSSPTLTPYSPMVLDLVNSPDRPLCCFGAVCGALPCQAVPRPVFPPLGACPALQQRKGLSE